MTKYLYLYTVTRIPISSVIRIVYIVGNLWSLYCLFSLPEIFRVDSKLERIPRGDEWVVLSHIRDLLAGDLPRYRSLHFVSLFSSPGRMKIRVTG